MFIYFIVGLCLVLFYAIIIEPNRVKVSRVLIKNQKLKLCFEGLTVVHLSDLHISRIGYREKRLLHLIKKIDPDILFFTGDFGRQTKSITPSLDFFRNLNPRYGIWAVPGNTDYYPRNKETERCHVDELLEQADQLPFKFLKDVVVKLNLNGSPFYLIAIDDPDCPGDYIFPKDEIRVENVLKKAKDNIAKIVLVHQPDVFDLSMKHNVDLVLCGHTHGGQLILPFNLHFFDKSEYAKKYSKGLYKQQNTYLYTTSGVGTTRLPMRFGARPEINLIQF